jgi:hypothetical protein
LIVSTLANEERSVSLVAVCKSILIPYSGKCPREKTFANFVNKRAFAKFLFVKSQKGGATLREWGGEATWRVVQYIDAMQPVSFVLSLSFEDLLGRNT